MSQKETCNRERLYEVVDQAGFRDKLDDLPDKFDSMLAREFDDQGVLLSGGKMQKLAIARVLYRNADCYILDEPTAGLDPVAEAEFNQQIMTFADDKLLIIISHRLTTTRFVDSVIVLKDGKIKEIGSHDELMARKGIYYYLFQTQAEQYMDLY